MECIVAFFAFLRYAEFTFPALGAYHDIYWCGDLLQPAAVVCSQRVDSIAATELVVDGAEGKGEAALTPKGVMGQQRVKNYGKRHDHY